MQRISLIPLITVLLLIGCHRSGTSQRAKVERKPSITAEPNPVPPGPDPGSTRLTCDLGDDLVGEVYVSINGGEDKRIFGIQNARELPWINAGATYEFR